MTRHRGISLIASHEGEPMRIAKNLLALFAVSLITDALAVAPSTSALAAGGALWVSSGTISGGNGTSCNAPGFNSIQDAIAAAAANRLDGGRHASRASTNAPVCRCARRWHVACSIGG